MTGPAETTVLVSLVIRGFSSTPEQLTERLARRPTRTGTRGDERRFINAAGIRSVRRLEHSYWELRSALPRWPGSSQLVLVSGSISFSPGTKLRWTGHDGLDLEEAGAKVKWHPTKTGEGVAIDFGEGTMADVRVENHPPLGPHGNVQVWKNGVQVQNTHITQ